MSFKLGLTGSIGMGKTTTAKVFAAHGCGIWNADAAVHRLYERNGAAVAAIGAVFPQIIANATVDRQAMRQLIASNPKALSQIEKIVHPLVAQDRKNFTETASQQILVYDIPLLFETKANDWLDAVICVYIDSTEQQRRVIARGTMTITELEFIRDKQMPIADKLSLSDFKIITDTKDGVAQQVAAIIKKIKRRSEHA